MKTPLLTWVTETSPRLVFFVRAMEQISFFWSRIVEIYQQVFSMLRKNPTVFCLFFATAFFDLVALIVLYFAPSPPISDVLAPIIRSFWGDHYLHYPNNFLLLPRLFGHAHFLISTVFGVFMTGIIIKKIEAEILGKTISTVSAVVPVLRRYLSLVAVWLVSYGTFIVLLKGVMMFLPHNLWIQLISGFILGLLVQSVFAFLIPAIVLIENGFFKKLLEGFRLGIKNILLISALIFVPTLFALILSVARFYTPVVVQVYPELVLWILSAGIVITLVVDVLVTSSATLLFLKVRQGK